MDWSGPSLRTYLPTVLGVGRHYKRAPIAEAIIEIRIEPLKPAALDALVNVVSSDVFPVIEKSIDISGRVDVTDEKIHGDAVGHHVGYFFRREDNARIVHLRLDKFSFSWLPPYDKWGMFLQEAWRYWTAYREAISPTRINRIGVRYVNKIDVPASAEIRDYLRTAIDVSAYLPQAVESYFLQVAVPLDEDGPNATITSMIVEPPSPQHTSLLLDIDTWQEVDLAAGIEADEIIRDHLETLRKAKNYVFEACITDATRGLIS